MSCTLFQKKANTIATVLIIIMSLVSAGIYTSNNLKANKKAEDTSAITESSITLRRALLYGVSNFLESDMIQCTNESYQKRLWYCNYPYPASLYQINRSLGYYLNDSVHAYLTELTSQTGTGNYTILIFPQLTIQNISTINELQNFSVNIDVQNFTIEIKHPQTTRRIDVSKDESFYMRLWYIYNGIYRWMKEDAGNITQHLYTSVFDIMQKPCQAYRCSCNNAGVKLIKQSEVDKLKINKAEIEQALKLSINQLTNEFSGSSITCDITLDSKSQVINTITVNQSRTELCDNRETKYVKNYTDAGDVTFTALNDTFLSDCNTNNSLANFRNWDIAIKRSDDTFFNFSYTNKTVLRPAATIMYRYTGFMIEKVSASTSARLLAHVECTDKETGMETDRGFTEFKVTIDLGINLVRNCPSPPIDPYTSNSCESEGEAVQPAPCDPSDYDENDLDAGCGDNFYNDDGTINEEERACWEIQCENDRPVCVRNPDKLVTEEPAVRQACSISEGSYYTSDGKALACLATNCDRTECKANPDATGQTLSDDIKLHFCDPCKTAECDSNGYVRCVDDPQAYDWTPERHSKSAAAGRISSTYDDYIKSVCISQGKSSTTGDYECYNLQCNYGTMECATPSDHDWEYYYDHYNYNANRNSEKTFKALFKQVCSKFSGGNLATDGTHISCYKMRCSTGDLTCAANDGNKYYSSWYEYYDYWDYSTIWDSAEQSRCVASGLNSECINYVCAGGRVTCTGNSGGYCIPTGGTSDDYTCNQCNAAGQCLPTSSSANCGSYNCKKCISGRCTLDSSRINQVCIDPRWYGYSDSCLTGCDASGGCTVPLGRGTSCGSSNECYAQECDVPAAYSYGRGNNTCVVKPRFNPTSQKCCGSETSPFASICSQTDSCCSVNGEWYCSGCGTQ